MSKKKHSPDEQWLENFSQVLDQAKSAENPGRYFTDSLRYVQTPRSFEFISGPSMTQPDDTPTMREIVERYTKGQLVPGHLMREESNDSGADFDSIDLEKFSTLDLTEREEIRSRVAQETEAMQNAIKAHQEALRAAHSKSRREDDEASGGHDKTTEKRSARRSKEMDDESPKSSKGGRAFTEQNEAE